MPSSISSSEGHDLSGSLPERPWPGMALAVLLLVAAGFGAWEWRVRAQGYVPTYNDNANLWASRRALAAGAERDQIVFVGASRTLFDMDLALFQEATGGPLPIQIATVGSSPVPILTDLAEDESYAGSTTVGIAPGLAAAGAGPPVASPARYVKHYQNWSPSDRFELPLSLWLQDRLALINQDDLNLPKLIENGLDLPNRPDAYAPRIPGFMYLLDETRRARMIDRVVEDEDYQREIQQIWIPLFSGPPKPAVFTAEQWEAMLREGWERQLAQIVADVEAIEARGGRVIFQRLPSTDRVRELERELTPRAAIWDRILEETGAPGIHFEDHPELQGYDCPEWSHLTAPESERYTRALIEIMRREGLLPGE